MSLFIMDRLHRKCLFDSLLNRIEVTFIIILFRRWRRSNYSFTLRKMVWEPIELTISWILPFTHAFEAWKDACLMASQWNVFGQPWRHEFLNRKIGQFSLTNDSHVRQLLTIVMKWWNFHEFHRLEMIRSLRETKCILSLLMIVCWRRKTSIDEPKLCGPKLAVRILFIAYLI